jgi:hypothetical protein
MAAARRRYGLFSRLVHMHTNHLGANGTALEMSVAAPQLKRIPKSDRLHTQVCIGLCNILHVS